MNLKNIARVIVAVVSLAVVAGCGDRQLPNPPAPTGSIDAQIKAVQNNPNLGAPQKAQIIGQLQMQQARAKSGTPQ